MANFPIKKKPLNPVEAAAVNPTSSIMSNNKPPVVQPPPVQQINLPVNNQPQVIRDQETGLISGVKFPDGRTVLGSSRDIRGLIDNFTAKEGTPVGAVEAGQVALQNQQQQVLQQQQQALIPTAGQEAAAAQVGQTQPGITRPLTEGLSPLGAGIAGAVSGGAIGLAGGPAAPATVPIGAAVGFTSGVLGELARERHQQVKNEVTDFSNTVKGLKAAVNIANAGGDPQKAVELYNMNLQKIRDQQAELKQILKTTGGDKLSGGRDELIRITDFLDGGQLQNYNALMADAVRTPNPTRHLDLTDFGDNQNS